ncbi:MAG: lamin tail domain-containing protein [Deltaproteobacteria bacterium]|nr:lamin tail domain-containing protein [Deltaproteobacteria bacterium]MCB9788835.1 lamin tail domain-containing protein [Deltaproteobacteria bacterium]
MDGVGDVCAAAATPKVVIQELLYDGPGADADDVFTELMGPPGMSLTGWSLVGINGANGTLYHTVNLDGVVIPSDGILVLATSTANAGVAPYRDVAVDVDWQNGPDAVQLWDATGVMVDALQYGNAGSFNAGEGDYASTTPAGQSLSRDASGTDTDDNATDFTVGAPTPGTP